MVHPFRLPAALLAGLTGVLVAGCHSGPVATSPAASPPPPAAIKPTAADTAAALSATPASATGQSVPFVGKPNLKAVLRSAEGAPAAPATR